MSVVIDAHHVIDIIDEQIARNDTLLRSRHIDVQVDCDSDLVWYFDSELLGGVLNNLIVNCARYSKKQLLIRAGAENGYLSVTIADDGEGYPDNMLMGSLPQTPVSFNSGNTRLGLLFTRKVLELHRSKKGQGYMTIANNGPLGGGVLKLYVP